jgi:MFS family permease
MAERYMKKILAITFLNFFISGGLTLTIPLLLLERNIELIEISVILSVLPLVFFLVRLLFAALADLKGWTYFIFLLNWPANLFSTIIFAIANSTSFFFLGKTIEAIKQSSYWSVIRTAIFLKSPKKEEREATKNLAVLSLATAIGYAISGIGIVYGGFLITFGIFVFASTLIGIPTLLLWCSRKKQSRSKRQYSLKLLDPRRRNKNFWFMSLTVLFFRMARYPLLILLLPIFMAQQLGYDYITIGIAYMLYKIISSSFTFSTLKISLSLKRAVIQSTLFVFGTSVLANSYDYFLVPFLVLAIAEGLGIGFFESTIAKATKKELTVSFDIGLLQAPMRIAEFTSLLLAGFVAQSMGYTPIFVLLGFFFAIFSFLSWYILKSEINEKQMLEP